MRSNFLPLLFLLAILLLSGCAGRKVSLAKKEVFPPLNLAYQIESIKITDSRANTSTDEISLPVMSKRKQYIKHFPALTTAHRTLIKNIVKHNAANTGTLVQAEVIIVDAYKIFSATRSLETERGFAHLEIRFLDSRTGEAIAGSEAKSSFSVSSLDATFKRIEEVYQLCLRNAMYGCLKSVKDQHIEVSL